MITRRQCVFISGPNEMRSWTDGGHICQAGKTCWTHDPLFDFPQYTIPENYRCDLEDVWPVVRFIRKEFGEFEIQGDRLIMPTTRVIKRRKKVKTTMLPEKNWGAIFVTEDGKRFYDGVIALLVGAKYHGDFPDGKYEILQEPRIGLGDLNAVLRFVNQQFPEGWRVEDKEVVAGKPDEIELPKLKYPEWEQKYRDRIKKENAKKKQERIQARGNGIREILKDKPRKIKRREKSPLQLGLDTIMGTRKIRRR